MPSSSLRSDSAGDGRPRSTHMDAQHSPNSTALVSSPRPARRTPRQRSSSVAPLPTGLSPATPNPPPSAPPRSHLPYSSRSDPRRGEVESRGGGGRYNSGNNNNSSRISDSNDGSASEAASFGDASSVLSFAMYHPHRARSARRGYSGGMPPPSHHPNASISSSLASSAVRRLPSASRSSLHEGRSSRRLATPSQDLSFDSAEVTSSLHSSNTPRSSRGSFSGYQSSTLRHHSPDGTRASSGGGGGAVVYRPPGHRAYRAEAMSGRMRTTGVQHDTSAQMPHPIFPSIATPIHSGENSLSASSTASDSALVSEASYPPPAAQSSPELANVTATTAAEEEEETAVADTHTRRPAGSGAFSIVASVTRSTNQPTQQRRNRSGSTSGYEKHNGQRKSSPTSSSTASSTSAKHSGGSRRARSSSSAAAAAAPPPPQDDDRRRRGRSRGGRHPLRSSVDDVADAHAALAPAAAAPHRSVAAPLSRRPVVTWRSTARVCAIASVPSGQVLTGGDATGLIEMWDRRTGRRLCGLGGHQAPVLSLLIIPNTSLLLSGGADRTARVWELRTLQNTLVLEGHRGIITALEALWLPDAGLNLFTGSDDGTVRQWRAATGACVHVYRGHRGPVNVVAALRPVKYIATGAGDGFFKVWNVQTLRCLSTIAAVPSRTSSSATGSAAAGAATAGSSATGGGGGGGSTTGEAAGGGGRRSRVAATSSGATGSSSAGAVWDIVQLHDADNSIVTATDDGAVRFWASHGNQHTLLLKELHLPGVLLRARSAARCLLACGAYLFVGGARGELYVWDTSVLPYAGTVRTGGESQAEHLLRAAGGGSNPSSGTSSSAHRALAAAALSSGGRRSLLGTGGGASPSPHAAAAAMGNAAAESPGDSDEPTELFEATFLFHTAAITGLTRQGAQLCSSSLDHTVCRWSLHDLIPLEAIAPVAFDGDGALMTAGRPSYLWEDGWTLPSAAMLAAVGGGRMGGEGGAASIGYRGGGSFGMGIGVVAGEAVTGVPLWPITSSGGGGAGAGVSGVVLGGAAVGVLQQQQQQQHHPLLQSAVTAPFASPLALLRNPKEMLEGDAAAAAAAAAGANETGTANFFSELSPAEAAAAYTELPLTFLIEHLRSAAISPVDLRSMAKALCLALFTLFFVLYYALVLAPCVSQSSDVTNGVFAQTATYPLPSFARPHTFASISSPAQLERWLMLMMDQVSTLAAPVQIVVKRQEQHNNNSEEGEEEGSAASSAKDASEAAVGVGGGGGSGGGDDGVTGQRTTLRKGSGQPRRSAAAAPRAEKSARTLSDTKDSGETLDSSTGSSATSPTTDPDPASVPRPSRTELLTLPALPGGVAFLRQIRLRVKHVTNTSCQWNPHVLRPASSTTPTTPGRECFGKLSTSTESCATLCPEGSGGDVMPFPALGNNSVYFTGIAGGDCLAHTKAGAGIAFYGLFQHYDTAGYAMDLPFYTDGMSDAEEFYQPLRMMRRLRLVDEQRTRLVDAMFFTYHIHSQIFVRLHYTLEMPRGGAWMASTSMTPCPLFNFSNGFRGHLALACALALLLLALLLLGLQLYDAVMAFYVGKLLRHLISFTAFTDITIVTLGMCVVGYSFRWIVASRGVDVDTLLRASVAPPTVSTLQQAYGMRTAPAEYTQQITRLNRVTGAFRGVTMCAAVEAVILFLTLAITVGRLFTFLQIIESAVRQIRLQLLTAAVMMLLVIFAFALAFHALFGGRYFAFGTVRLSFWHFLLYSTATQSGPVDALNPTTTDRRVVGKLLLFVFNYVCRLLCYVYVVSLVIERVQAVARITPHISLRVLLAKWWYDVQYQVALTRQGGPDVGTGSTGGGGSAAAAAAGTPADTAPTEESKRHHQQYPQKRRTAGEEKKDEMNETSKRTQRSALAASLATSGHRRVVIEHIWRRLRHLQHEQEEVILQRQEQQQQATSSASLSASAPLAGYAHLMSEVDGVRGGRQTSFASVAHFLERQANVMGDGGGDGGFMDSDATGGASEGGRLRGRQGQGEVRGTRSSTTGATATGAAAAAASKTASTSGGATSTSNRSHMTGSVSDTRNTAEASLDHVRLRLTDLLLLLSEEERTPFARNVIRHAWDTLAWMYHYHQQHALVQNPEERWRRLRLESGIHEARLRLEPLLAVVRATQARLEAHEARLRPLAEAVVAVAAGER